MDILQERSFPGESLQLCSSEINTVQPTCILETTFFKQSAALIDYCSDKIPLLKYLNRTCI